MTSLCFRYNYRFGVVNGFVVAAADMIVMKDGSGCAIGLAGQRLSARESFKYINFPPVPDKPTIYTIVAKVERVNIHVR